MIGSCVSGCIDESTTASRPPRAVSASFSPTAAHRSPPHSHCRACSHSALSLGPTQYPRLPASWMHASYRLTVAWASRSEAFE